MSDAPHVPTETAVLPSGARMPLLGFGTWRLSGAPATRATADALAAGYRHIDTATMYDNEREIGQALRHHDRDAVFVTTKLHAEHAGRERPTLEASLERLGLDVLDLWLVHWPPAGAGEAVWEQMVAAREDGLVRDIGVSNHTPEQIDALERATGVRPAVNQVPWSPLRHDPALLAAHRERGVVLEGYSGLRHGTLEHPVVTGLAEQLGRTPAQVVVRWHLQHGVVVIPKSASADRIRANADVADFSLDQTAMAALDALGSQS